MRFFTTHNFAALTAVCCLLCGSCQSKQKATVAADTGPLPLPAADTKAQLGDAPTAFLRRQAKSPIHWHSWNPGILKTANDTRRLIMVLIGSSLYPSSDSVLATFADSPKITAEINGNYLPVLVDADACREMAIFAAELCTEIQKPVGFPFLLWLSPDGNPVAWTPVGRSDPESVREIFAQSSNMVASMWLESPDYVRDNSTRDAKLRLNRLARTRAEDLIPTDPTEQLDAAARRLCGFYDPLSRNIDGTGGLPPSGVFELLGRSATSPALPESLRQTCQAVVAGSAANLVHSSMIDPLDGGIYLARRGSGWNLPVFSRNTATQCRMSIALIACWRATGNQDFLSAATAALDFAEKGLGTGEGQIIHGTTLAKDKEPAMLWKTEELEHRLTPEEYRALSMASELRGLGNVPFGDDPNRQYFRLNVLGNRRSAAEIAPELGASAAATAALLKSAYKKLRKIRDQRIAGSLIVETAAYARHHARLASANAAAFAATGDPTLRDRAVAHLKTLKADYFDAKSGLKQFPKTPDPILGHARAVDYALTIQACLDVQSVTLDNSWLNWGKQLLDLASERFVLNTRMREFDEASKVIDIPLGDAVMVFGDSSCGVLHAAIERLSAFSYSAPTPLTDAIAGEMDTTGTSPVIHTDLILGTLTRHLDPVVLLGPEFGASPPDALSDAIRAGGPRRCTLVPDSSTPPDAKKAPAGQALLSVGPADPVPLSNPQTLAEWLRTRLAPPPPTK
jgi:uncharacterized protein YyaL (SSP411 family)